MSKAVRIREHLYREVERLARSERRSMISQLEVLLEQALALRDSGGEALEPEAAPSPMAEPPEEHRTDFK